MEFDAFLGRDSDGQSFKISGIRILWAERGSGLPNQLIFKSGWTCVLYMNTMYMSAAVHYTKRNMIEVE